jgi:hypothetical protein
MARFYKEIDKETFLKKVQDVMKSEDENGNDKYPYVLPKPIEKDLKKVNFSFENYKWFDDTSGFSDYPIGYKEIAPNFHIFFTHAGGDWEYPICFIFYWGDDKLRAYIPSDGNAWNKKEKCAYGSEKDYDNTEGNADEVHDKEISEEKMITEILHHITKK